MFSDLFLSLKAASLQTEDKQGMAAHILYVTGVFGHVSAGKREAILTLKTPFTGRLAQNTGVKSIIALVLTPFPCYFHAVYKLFC